MDPPAPLDRQDEGAGRTGPPASAQRPPVDATAGCGRPSASSDTRTPASRRSSTRSSARRSHGPRTSSSRRSIRRAGRSSWAMADTAIVTDTVGFIHKLPHQLVDVFRATLEEVNRADVLLEVVDASDPHVDEHRSTVQAVLDELGAGDKPRLVVFNKADLIDRAAFERFRGRAVDRRRGVRVGADRLRHGYAPRRDCSTAGPRCGSTSTSSLPVRRRRSRRHVSVSGGRWTSNTWRERDVRTTVGSRRRSPASWRRPRSAGRRPRPRRRTGRDRRPQRARVRPAAGDR